MKTFLLPCSCTTEIAVTSGQAGGRVACPSCGRSLVVPKLRELTGLQALPTGGSAIQPRWSLLQAVALGAAATALLSLAASLLVVPKQEVFSPQVIRDLTLAASDQEIYRIWKVGFANSSVRRPANELEQKMQRQQRFFGGIARVFQGLATIAGVVAATAFVASRRPPSTRHHKENARSTEALR